MPTTSKVRAVQELRRSNAARPHVSRKGTRRALKAAALKEQATR